MIAPIAAATTGAPGAPFERVLVPLLVLAALIVIAWVLIAAIRKQLHGPGPSPSTSFTLEQLRTMRQRGLLSDEEYRRATDLLTGDSRQKDHPEDPPLKGQWQESRAITRDIDPD